MSQRADELSALVGEKLEPFGLRPLGWFETTGEKPALLIGDQGGSHWEAFSKSGFLGDGKLDPMNRWTETIVGKLADHLSARPLFPFGERVWPFQQWAQAATGMAQSPLGLLIHPEYGLWNALRGAMVFDETFQIPPPPKLANPCATCVERPCLNTCPVSAFWEDHYYVESCRAHVASKEGADCKLTGCKARLACPIGQQHQYSQAQQAFHMRSFV